MQEFKNFKQVLLDDCDDIDIIENDVDKNYGVSNIHMCEEAHEENNSFVIDMFQTRMDVNNGSDYTDWYTKLSENGKGCWSKESDIKTCIAQHLDYWLQADDTTIPVKIPEMTIAELTQVLQTGFKAERLFVKIIN